MEKHDSNLAECEVHSRAQDKPTKFTATGIENVAARLGDVLRWQNQSTSKQSTGVFGPPFAKAGFWLKAWQSLIVDKRG
jgi:hypothetical protein